MNPFAWQRSHSPDGRCNKNCKSALVRSRDNCAAALRVRGHAGQLPLLRIHHAVRFPCNLSCKGLSLSPSYD